MIYNITNLDFCYKKNSKLLLKNVNLSFTEGNLIAIIGKNGCGKSTFLKILSGIIKNYTGDITFYNTNLKNYTNKQLASKLSYMGQDNYGNIPLTVKDVVALGGFACQQNDDKISQALYLTETIDFAECDFDKLSGGQKQKIMLARAIYQNSKILLLDEPTASLDIVAKDKIFRMLSELTKKNSLVIMTSHDIDFVKKYATKIIFFLNQQSFVIEPNELDEQLINKIFV